MMKRILGSILGILGIVVSLIFLQQLFMPKYSSGIVEGAMIESYYDEPKNHDVVFIGDCEVYGNFSPITLWENFGIKSFIRGSAQQLIWQSYYLMEETLRYEKPDVIVFNVLSLKYDTPQREAYNRMTLDGMKWSTAKWRSIRASMVEGESMTEYVFPFLRYHTRWNELTSDDFKYLFEKPQMFHNGYYMRVDVKPVVSMPRVRALPDYSFGENAMMYLDKMVALAKANDVELMLIKAPSVYPVWHKEWDDQMVAYAQANDLVYVNLLDLSDEMGIDFTKDTYDGGLHLNLSGAEKLSKYFGQLLVDAYALKDHRGDMTVSQYWQGKVNFYGDMMAQQMDELKRYGYLLSFGNPPAINE